MYSCDSDAAQAGFTRRYIIANTSGQREGRCSLQCVAESRPANTCGSGEANCRYLRSRTLPSQEPVHRSQPPARHKHKSTRTNRQTARLGSAPTAALAVNATARVQSLLRCLMPETLGLGQPLAPAGNASPPQHLSRRLLSHSNDPEPTATATMRIKACMSVPSVAAAAAPPATRRLSVCASLPSVCLSVQTQKHRVRTPCSDQPQKVVVWPSLTAAAACSKSNTRSTPPWCGASRRCCRHAGRLHPTRHKPFVHHHQKSFSTGWSSAGRRAPDVAQAARATAVCHTRPRGQESCPRASL